MATVILYYFLPIKSSVFIKHDVKNQVGCLLIDKILQKPLDFFCEKVYNIIVLSYYILEGVII